MAAPSIPPHRLPGAGILNRFNVPAYAAWAAVACVPLWRWLWRAESVPRMGYAGFALLGVLALYLLRAELEAEDAPLLPRCATIVGQILLSLLAFWALRDDLTPALLVMCAAQVGSRFPKGTSVLTLVAANGALGVMMLSYLPHDFATEFFAYACFQLFASEGARYTLRLQETQDMFQRVNTQLLSTRHLLDESVRAEERLRLSRELHDVTGHKLTALKMQLAAHGLKAGAQPAVSDWEHLADELLADIRSVVGALRQHDGVDLQQALRALDPGLARPAVRIELEPGLRVDDIREAEALLRCAQEGLTNALRHSLAANVSLRLARGAEGIVLTVEDDGRGRVERLTAGNGLHGLEERLQEVGGRLELRNQVPSGIVLRAVLPEGSPVKGVETQACKAQAPPGASAVGGFIRSAGRLINTAPS